MYEIVGPDPARLRYDQQINSTWAHVAPGRFVPQFLTGDCQSWLSWCRLTQVVPDVSERRVGAKRQETCRGSENCETTKGLQTKESCEKKFKKSSRPLAFA